MNIKKLFITGLMALVPVASNAATNTDIVCSYAPSQSAAVNRITATASGATVGAAAMLQATGLSIVAHSSGGYILTGAGGYVAGTLVGPFVVPVAVTASVIVAGAVVAVELTCAPRNHPDAVKSVARITKEFNRAVRAANARAVDVRDGAVMKIRELNANAIVERDAAVDKVRAANERAIEIRDGSTKLFSGYF
jgi:hypothetical protein